MAKKEAKTVKENKKSFFKGFKAELKKVSWPTPKQLVNNTIAVVTIVLITALIVFVLDLAFESVNKYGIDKVKEIITTSNTTSEETENVDNNETEENIEQQEETITENTEVENVETNTENSEQ